MAVLTTSLAGASGRRHAPKAIRPCLVGFALLFAYAPRLVAQASEYQVKAVFLFNFVQFVDWPAAAFPTSTTPLIIGVLGNDPFGPFLDATVRGETVRGRPLEVRRYQTVNEIGTCHVLYISSSEEGRLDDILSDLKDRPVLTVSETAGFDQRGGMIRFVSERSRIRLRINPDAAEAANLTISSKLLQAAEVVTPAKP